MSFWESQAINFSHFEKCLKKQFLLNNTAFDPVHRFIFSGRALLTVPKSMLKFKDDKFPKLDIYTL